MRNLLLVFLLCLGMTVHAQTNVGQLIREGVSLHDKGDFTGAIAKYDAALQLEPDNYEAMYEKSYSLMSIKDYDKAEDLLKKILKDCKDPQFRRLSYVTYGTLYDLQGKAKKSLKVYEDGIREFPDSYLLYFNKGITQAGMNETGDAIISFQQALYRNPYHASSHNALARLMADRKRIPAILSLVSFLLIEPTGRRAEENVALLNKLVMRGVQRTGEKAVTINIDASVLGGDKKNKEDDFGPAELMLSLVAANNEMPDSLGAKTEADRLSYKLQLLISAISGKEGNDKGFFKTFYVPFLTEMKKNELVAITSYIILSSSDDAAIAAWLKENKDDVSGFYRWFENYAWPKG